MRKLRLKTYSRFHKFWLVRTVSGVLLCSLITVLFTLFCYFQKKSQGAGGEGNWDEWEFAWHNIEGKRAS